jgi:hypothetical protein
LKSCWVLVFGSVLLLLAACRSAEIETAAPHPYKVVLLPVEGAKAALEQKLGEDDVPLALTAPELEAKIRDGVRTSRAFSDVVVADPADLKSKTAEDEMQAAADLARRTSSDLILRVQVKSARMTDLGANGSTFWSTLTWFMAGLPSFWMKDRSYETDLVVQAELYDPADPVKPTASVVAGSQTQDLDLWDRGLSPFVVVVPPAFLKGSAKSVSETLTERAMTQLLASLVEQLRTREIPSRFDMEVVEEAGGVRLAVTSRRRLRSLDVEVDGKPVRSWAETGLVEDKDSAADRFVYRRVVDGIARPGALVHVIAEDEAGGREVRTVRLGGAK